MPFYFNTQKPKKAVEKKNPLNVSKFNTFSNGHQEKHWKTLRFSTAVFQVALLSNAIYPQISWNRGTFLLCLGNLYLILFFFGSKFLSPCLHHAAGSLQTLSYIGLFKNILILEVLLLYTCQPFKRFDNYLTTESSSWLKQLKKILYN